MATKKSSTKKDLLDLESVPTALVSSFMIEKIELKDMMWFAQFRITGILPKSYHQYQMKMTFDEKPYLTRIERLNEKIENAKKSAKLFDDMTKEEVNDIKDEIKDVEKEMLEVKKQCLTIEFPATVEQVKWSNGNTNVRVRIPDNVIEPMNKSKTMFSYYKIELIAVL